MSDVVGQFNYFQWQPKFESEKPYYLYTDPPPGHPNANFATAPGASEVIRDVRGKEHEFNLDDHGFAFATQKLPLENFTEEAIVSKYLPSLEVLIRNHLGQDCEIIWFDWRVRSDLFLVCFRVLIQPSGKI